MLCTLSLAPRLDLPSSTKLSTERRSFWATQLPESPAALCSTQTLPDPKVCCEAPWTSTAGLPGLSPNPGHNQAVCKRLQNPPKLIAQCLRKTTEKDKGRQRKGRLNYQERRRGSEQHEAERKSTGKDDCPSSLHSW